MKKEKKEYKGSIRRQLTARYILFAIIPLVIVNLVSSNQTEKILQNTTSTLMTEMVKQTTFNLTAFLDDIEKNATKFVINNLNDKGNNLINNYQRAGESVAQAQETMGIKTQLNQITSIEKAMNSAAIITNEGKVIGNLSRISEGEMAVFKEIEVADEGLWKKGVEGYENHVFYMRKISNTFTGADFGQLVIEVDLSELKEILGAVNLLEGSKIYIVDELGNIAVTPEEHNTILDESTLEVIKSTETVGSEVTGDMLVAYGTGINGWRVVAEIPTIALTSQIKDTSMQIWILIIIASLLALVVGIITSRSFTKPIIKLMKLMKQAEEGDLTVEFNIKGKDEIGLLAQSFNHMIKKIQLLLEDAKNLIEDTTIVGEVLGQSTGHSVETFRQLALSIEEIAAGSTAQAESAHESTQVMEQLSSRIQEVRENTEDIYEATQGAHFIIKEAHDSIEILNVATISSSDVAEKIKVGIEELGIMTRSIGDIMQLLDTVSEQTNLLALNASIEAARAGEVGKGFAVVANEVRKLAEQSKISTEQVRKTLNTIEDKTVTTTKLVYEANKIFDNQAHAVRRNADAFSEIIDRLKQIDSQLGRVNDKVIDMEDMKGNMSKKIESIAIVTIENASAVEEVSALSEEQRKVIAKLDGISGQLADKVKQLTETVGTFKVEK